MSEVERGEGKKGRRGEGRREEGIVGSWRSRLLRPESCRRKGRGGEDLTLVNTEAGGGEE
jgi:hypothetical protein